MKRCGKCKEEKSFENFHKAKREKDGYQCWCILCRKEHKKEERKEYHKQRYHSDKSNYLNWKYQRAYGITLEEYNTLLSNQNGLCSICSSTCLTGRRLAVDHDHLTGKVRGLLCSNCNKGLGNFQDSTALLQKAKEYLKKYERV